MKPTLVSYWFHQIHVDSQLKFKLQVANEHQMQTQYTLNESSAKSTEIIPKQPIDGSIFLTSPHSLVSAAIADFSIASCEYLLRGIALETLFQSLNL